MSKKFRILFHARSDGRWQEEHIDEHGNAAVVGIRTSLPPGARPVDEEEEAEARRLRRDEREAGRFERLRSTDPRFGDVQGRMREEADSLPPEEVQKLDTDYQTFNRRYTELRLEELRKDHEQRKEAIRELQHSIRGTDRQRGDDLMLEEHGRFAREKERLERGDFSKEESEQ